MPHNQILVVDDNADSLNTIALTLNDAQLPFTVVNSNEAAWKTFQANSTITLVLARAFGKNILGTELCRQIRTVKSHSEVPVMIILREDELVKGAEALLAGASDLLVDPFEPRELRMRANIVPGEQARRVDRAHTIENQDPAAPEPEFFVPVLDHETSRMTFGKHESRRKHWDNDPDVKKIALDKVIVCPECEAIPTFRQGCGACGSAWTEQEVLIHHYACAYVGPEQEFLTADGMVCPKCRLRSMVAGSDFEQIKGVLRCTDCDAVFTEQKMIGHCLACQHRFAAADGKAISLYGYKVGRSPNSAIVAAPSYLTAGVDSQRPVVEHYSVLR